MNNFTKRFQRIRYKKWWLTPLLCLAGYFAIPLPHPLFPEDYSTVILDDQDKILRVFLNQRQQWHFPPNPDLQVPEKLTTAVLQFEDRFFYYHPGINPVALGRAFFQNLSNRRIVSGASTITMQVARLLQPKPRTLPNKILEILQAFKIELNYSKREILRFYLNYAPYGSNIVGYQTASMRYFQKMPHELTWGEAALLAVIPNSPGHISPMADITRLRIKRNELLHRLLTRNFIDSTAYSLAILEEIPSGYRPFEMLAPHFTEWQSSHLPTGGFLQTTIHQDLQKNIEELVKGHIHHLSGLGIRNTAALVVETVSGKVRAYVGSPDYFDESSNGFVDGVRAPRSAGSLLKPLLYALSFDEGIILPQSLMKDIPTYYGAFSPQNANETFQGLVTAREALVRSLNVPAVRLLYTYGIYRFYLFLQSARLSTLIRQANEYGLPLILGGVEVSPWDMARFYRALGRGGIFEPLQVLKEAPDFQDNPPPALISPGAAYLTLDILRELKRPGAEYYWEQYQNQWPLAWKTGTSYGQRDAWAVGVSPQWTIAVWVGNFTGEGNANLSGAESAAPLLFDIFNSLPKNPGQSWFSFPEGDFQEIQICRKTGFIAGSHCPERVPASAPVFMKALAVCPFHQKFFMDDENAYAVCSRCWTPGGYHTETFPVYPPDVMQYLREKGQLTRQFPRHNPECPAFSSAAELQILYPRPGSKIWLPRDFDGSWQKITLKAAHRQDQRILFWYLDDHFLGSTQRRHHQSIALEKGWHQLEIIDDLGNRKQRRFYVDRRN